MAESTDSLEGLNVPLELPTCLRPRLREPIDIDKLLTTGTTFKIDTDLDLALLDEEDCEFEMFCESLFEEMPERKSKSALSNIPYREECGNYDHLVKTMKDITGRADGGVLKMVLQDGFGKKVEEMSLITVHFVAFCENDTEPYESTLYNGRPNRYVINSEEPLLPGYHVAFSSMQVGEVSKFVIDHHYGFGELGCPPRIKKASRILLFAELLDASPLTNIPIPKQSKEERALLEFSVIAAEARKLKSEGNRFYMQKRYQKAVSRYKLATEVLEDFPVVEETDEETRNQLLFDLYSNIAQSYVRLEKSPQACVACKAALRIRESEEIKNLHYKIYYRFALAKFQLGDYVHAKFLLNKALQQQPDIRQLNKLMIDIDEKMEKDQSALSRMYKEMMSVKGKPKSDTSTSPKVVPKVEKAAEDTSENSSASSSPVAVKFPCQN